MYLSEAQNEYGFGMIPGYGLCDGCLSSLAKSGSPACKLSLAPEFERCPLFTLTTSVLRILIVSLKADA